MGSNQKANRNFPTGSRKVMINWYNVIANGLWITGLALLLAVISHSRWEARQYNRPWKQVLSAARWQRRLDLAMAFFTAGLCATAATWYEQGIWGLLCLIYVGALLHHYRDPGRQ